MAKVILRPLPPKAAISYFRRKGYKFSWKWTDVWQQQHAKAFTVAHCMRMDVLMDIRKEVDKAIAEGITLTEFKKNLIPLLQTKGWWGKKFAVTPEGQAEAYYEGTPWRLDTIFQTNVQVAYHTGRFTEQTSIAEKRPWWMYDAVNDSRTRPEHAAMDGTVRRYDDPFWETWYPPNGFRCRCSVIEMDNQDLIEAQKRDSNIRKGKGIPLVIIDRRTGEIFKNPIPDIGWDFNPAKAGWKPDLERYPQELQDQLYLGIGKELTAKKLTEIIGKHKDLFKRGFVKVKYSSASKWFMSTDSRGTINIATKKRYWDGITPKKDLENALRKLGKEDLTQHEEYAIESLWHEILHNRQVLETISLSRKNEKLYLLETINQFVARHTYPEFINMLVPGTKAKHQDWILEHGKGYSYHVRLFRELLKRIGIKETEILPEIQNILETIPCDQYFKPLTDLLKRKTKKENFRFIKNYFNILGFDLS